MNKICCECRIDKDISLFYKNKWNATGVGTKCKECQKKYNKEYLKNHKCYLYKLNKNWKLERPWYRYLRYLRQRCNSKNYNHYKYYGGKGIKALITPKELELLWKRDKAYKMKKPSIDRIDSKGNYEISNCRFIELSENISRAHAR